MCGWECVDGIGKDSQILATVKQIKEKNFPAPPLISVTHNQVPPQRVPHQPHPSHLWSVYVSQHRLLQDCPRQDERLVGQGRWKSVGGA